MRGGATDIVLLMTRPSDMSRSPSGWIDRQIVAPYLARIHPDLAKHYLLRSEDYDKDMETIRSYNTLRDDIRMLPIQIDSTEPTIHPFEKSRMKLVGGAISGFRAVYKAFGISNTDFVEIITPTEDCGYSTALNFKTNNTSVAGPTTAI